MTEREQLEEAIAGLVREGLARNRPDAFPSCGRSMQPLVLHGSRLQVEAVDPASLRRGEIAVFARGQELVAHRVVGFRQEGDRKLLVTKGDWRAAPDDPVPEECVVGRVTAIERRGRRIRLDTRQARAMGHVAAWVSPATRPLAWLLRALRGAPPLGPWRTRLGSHPAAPPTDVSR